VRSRRLTLLLLTVLLGALLFGWGHAAEHNREMSADGSCATCQWVKHSPAGAVPATQALAMLVFVALVVVSAPLARGGAAVVRPSGRAPPRAA
jgi:hypothetical protein